MKKTILLLASITLFSCSADSEALPKETIANKTTEKRVEVIDYNAQKTISDTGFKPHGTSVFYSNNSNDCGKNLGGDETYQMGTLNGVKVQINTSYRYVVTCN